LMRVDYKGGGGWDWEWGGAGWQVKRQEVSKYSNVCKMI